MMNSHLVVAYSYVIRTIRQHDRRPIYAPAEIVNGIIHQPQFLDDRLFYRPYDGVGLAHREQLGTIDVSQGNAFGSPSRVIYFWRPDTEIGNRFKSFDRGFYQGLPVITHRIASDADEDIAVEQAKCQLHLHAKVVFVADLNAFPAWQVIGECTLLVDHGLPAIQIAKRLTDRHNIVSDIGPANYEHMRFHFCHNSNLPSLLIRFLCQLTHGWSMAYVAEQQRADQGHPPTANLSRPVVCQSPYL